MEPAKAVTPSTDRPRTNSLDLLLKHEMKGALREKAKERNALFAMECSMCNAITGRREKLFLPTEMKNFVTHEVASRSGIAHQVGGHVALVPDEGGVGAGFVVGRERRRRVCREIILQRGFIKSIVQFIGKSFQKKILHY